MTRARARLNLVTISAPKIGHLSSDSDDAFAVANRLDGSGIRLAVADGATSSSFSGLWAAMLVQSFVSEPFLDEAALLARCSFDAKRWQATINAMTLPWHAKKQASRGAHATFAGVEITTCGDSAWRAIAIGDSCVMHLRDGRILDAFPYHHGASFDNHPKLLATSPIYNDTSGAGDITIAEGVALSGDVLILATDAVAKFLFDRSSDGFEPLFASLAESGAEECSLDTTVARLREAGELANDDLTAVIIIFV